MNKVKRFSLEERYDYQNRKVIYDKDADDDIELNNIYPIIDLLNKYDKQIAELQKQLKASEQLQNQKVIEVLDKVKYDLLDISSPYWQYFAKSGNAFMTYEDIEQWVKEFIDNQIKSLKGEK